MSTALTEMGGTEAWELMQRRAKALSAAELVPKEYRGAANLPNVMIALDMADRLHAAPIQVMQNLHIIQGRPSWSAQFLIATINQCGRFSPLRYEVQGDDPHADDYRCRAVAVDRETQQVCEGEWIDWRMVKGEGWASKPGSKWKTMPGQMFRYRAASFWCRAFAPEVSMGIYTDDEAREMVDVTPARVTGATPAALAANFAPHVRAETAEAETAEAAPDHDPATGEVSEQWTPSDDELADIRARELALEVQP